MKVTNLITPANNNAQTSESLDQQFLDLIMQFRDHMNDTDPTQLLAIIQKMDHLILINGTSIFDECKNNGYSEASKNWTEHFVSFFETIVTLSTSINQFHTEHPDAPLPQDSLMLLNEAMTQLHFLMTTKAT